MKKNLELTINLSIETMDENGIEHTNDEFIKGIRLIDDEVVDGFIVTTDIRRCNNTSDFFIKDYSVKKISII